MKTFISIRGFLSTAALILLFNVTGHTQVVVNNKNINDDKDLEYVQLMYYVDKATLRPVFYLDYGLIEPEYTDIIEPERDYKQKISINGEELNDRITVVWVLNKMHQAGWEYMGDSIYLPLRMMDKWHVFTLRRKNNSL
ncbi:MAG TPA: hypothetical protein VFI14_03920 [Chryseosolibacter sp.]|jgi:hypothetical protein|nr:hypothetical protein [Chryseosolibacter sp.]